MWRFWAGWALIGISVLWFGLQALVAWASTRRPIESGGVPTLDGALFPPMAFAAGVGLLGADGAAKTVAVWIAVTAVALVVHLAIARFVPTTRP